MPTTPISRGNGPALPPLFACEFCGAGVDPSAKGVWRKVTGWVENRKGGGVNAVAFPSPPMGWSCAMCMMDKRLGINRDQGELF